MGLLRDCENRLWNRWIVLQHYLEHVQQQDQGLGAERREGAGPVGLVNGNPPDLAENGIDLPAGLEADFPLMNSISSRLQKNNS